MTPSVTQVLGVYADFSALPDDGRLEAAADRGTRLHKWAALYCKAWDNKLPYVPNLKPDDDIALHASSFAMWHKEMVKEMLHSELHLRHPVWGYHGHLDFIFVLHNGETVLLDLKTPVTKSRLWCGQVAAYGELVQVNYPTLKIQRSGVLQTSPKGHMARVTWYETEARDLNAFLAALTAYKYFKGDK